MFLQMKPSVCKKMITMRYILIGLLLIGLFSCKNDAGGSSSESLEGKYVQSIGRNTIQFEDGTSYLFPKDTATKIVYLVRHAEKDTAVQNNPVLSKEGEKRAQNLRHILQGTPLDKIFSTMYNRTIFTVSNIAGAKGLNIEPYKPAGMRQLGEDIRSGKLGSRFLIVGHSNTTRSMANVLVEENYYDSGIDESDYDNFIVVILSGDKKEILSLKYK